jgi:phosphoenolpyruvate carboxykinase (GTP)
VDRVHGRAGAVDSPFGKMPRYEDLNWKGLAFDKAAYGRITDIAKTDAEAEVVGVKEWFGKFGGHLPKPLEAEREKLAQRVAAQQETWRAE